ncbi:MAG: STAS domain-containing protein [Nitrospirales bacterium]|nr:STAS domain-containing protein [Nitrospirales bacterium]
MNWQIQVSSEVLVVRIFGIIDQEIGSMFEKASERAVYLGKRKILIDFSEMESVGPLGVVLCGFGLHHFQQLGIPVALVRPPSSLLPVLQEHGLNGMPPVFLRAQDALPLN